MRCLPVVLRSPWCWLGLGCWLSLSGQAFGKITATPSRGFHEGAIVVKLASDSTGELRYTLDGSVPGPAQGKPFPAGGLRIETTTVLRAAVLDDEGKLVDRATHTYLFPKSVAQQTAKRPGYIDSLNSWRLRYNQFFDWEMDPDIVNDHENNGDIATHLLSLPSLSVALSREDFNHFYENHAERGIHYERPASVELLYPSQPAFESFRGFQVHCGIRMQGGGAALKARKKSFRLLFKKDYGPGKLRYPLFESAPHHASSAVDFFDNVILRAGGNANWSKDEAWKHEPATYLRDPLVRDSQIAVCGFVARSTFVHLYLNGFYFGLYNLAERPDDKFQASYWGGQPEDYHSLNHGGTVGGDASAWEDLLFSARPDAAFPELASRIDIPSFCDYLINQWCFGPGDWSWNNYYGGLRIAPEPGPVRFFTWDAEFSLWTHTGYLESNDRGWANPLFVHGFSRRRSPLIRLWNALTEHPDFKLAFADRVYRHCFGDGALTESQTLARFDRLMRSIESAIVAESARWGDSAHGQEDAPRTRHGNWYPECRALRKLISGNVVHFIADLQAEGLYPRAVPPILSPPPGPAPLAAGTVLTLSAPARQRGVIYFTTDESDPHAPVGSGSGPGEPSASAKVFEGQPFVLSAPTRLKARFLARTGEWSPLEEGLYLTGPLGFPLRITEPMAHPKGDQAYEFIEPHSFINRGKNPKKIVAGAFGIRLIWNLPKHQTLQPKGHLQ